MANDRICNYNTCFDEKFTCWYFSFEFDPKSNKKKNNEK